MPPLQTVRPGQPLDIDAATWNEFVEAARWLRANRAAGGAGPVRLPLVPQTTCLIRYPESSVSTLPALSVVGYGDVLADLTDEDDRLGANRRPAFDAADPEDGGQVAVTLEPIRGQDLGPAVTAGPVVALIDVSDADHTRAVAVAGVTDKFASAAGGGYPVLFKEAGTGEKYGVVLLGPTAPAAVAAYGYSTVSSSVTLPGPGVYLVWAFQSYFEQMSEGTGGAGVRVHLVNVTTGVTVPATTFTGTNLGQVVGSGDVVTADGYAFTMGVVEVDGPDVVGVAAEDISSGAGDLLTTSLGAIWYAQLSGGGPAGPGGFSGSYP